MAQSIKNLPAMWETWVWSQGWEDPLEEHIATYSSILAWRILWTEEPGGLQSMGSQRVGTIEHMCMMTCWEFWFCKELKDIVMCIPWGGTSTLPQGCSLVSWLLLSCLPSLISGCSDLLFETQGSSRRLESTPYKQEMGETERLLCPGAPQSPAWFQWEASFGY